MWYTDYSGQQLIKMNMNGNVARFPLASFNPHAMAVGSDGKFYVGSQNQADIDIVTTAGAVTQKAIPSADVIGYAGSMTLGPDGNVWFTENSHVGKITTGGAISEFAYSDGSTSNYYDSIASGPDGNLWVAEYFKPAVDKVTTAGTMTQFALACNPEGIVSAAGSLWIACNNNDFLQLNTAGTVIGTFYNYFGFSTNGNFLTVGPDGNPWFGTSSDSVIAEFNTANPSFDYYYPPANYGNDNALTAGPDGNVWAIDDTSHSVNVYILNILSVSPSSLSFPATGQNQTIVVTQPGTAAWTATSNNTSVATVTQAAPASNFTVTSVAAGTAKIIVSDAVGNSFVVHVTVL